MCLLNNSQFYFMQRDHLVISNVKMWIGGLENNDMQFKKHNLAGGKFMPL